jgi:CBS domain-containing protein
MATDTPATSVGDLRDLLSITPIREAMQLGLFECSPDTDVAAVAGLLASHRVHCLVVPSVDAEHDRRSWATVSDREVLAALLDGPSTRTAGEIARRDVVGVQPRESLLRAAGLMRQRDVAHLVVLSPGTDRPVGIVSSLDIARAAGKLAGTAST